MAIVPENEVCVCFIFIRLYSLSLKEIDSKESTKNQYVQPISEAVFLGNLAQYDLLYNWAHDKVRLKIIQYFDLLFILGKNIQLDN